MGGGKEIVGEGETVDVGGVGSGVGGMGGVTVGKLSGKCSPAVT